MSSSTSKTASASANSDSAPRLYMLASRLPPLLAPASSERSTSSMAHTGLPAARLANATACVCETPAAAATLANVSAALPAAPLLVAAPARSSGTPAAACSAAAGGRPCANAAAAAIQPRERLAPPAFARAAADGSVYQLPYHALLARLECLPVVADAEAWARLPTQKLQGVGPAPGDLHHCVLLALRDACCLGSQRCCMPHAAQRVDQLALQRSSARPDAPLRHGLGARWQQLRSPEGMASQQPASACTAHPSFPTSTQVAQPS